MTPRNHFRTVTPVWIHIWRWNDALGWCCLEEVPYCFSWSSVKFQGHTAKKSWILTRIGRFRSVTPIWIQQWLWNVAQSLKRYRRGTLLFFKVICQIFRLHGTKKSPILTRIECFRTVTPVWIHRWLWNDIQSLMWYRRGVVLFFEVTHQISRSCGTKKSPILTRIQRFLTVTQVWLHRWIWNDAQRAWCSIQEVPYYFWRSSIKFHGHRGWKINDLYPIWDY